MPQGLITLTLKPDKVQLHLATLNLSKEQKSLPYPRLAIFQKLSHYHSLATKHLSSCTATTKRHFLSLQSRETYSRLNVSTNIIIDQFSRNDQTSLISIPWGERFTVVTLNRTDFFYKLNLSHFKCKLHVYVLINFVTILF